MRKGVSKFSQVAGGVVKKSRIVEPARVMRIPKVIAKAWEGHNKIRG